MELTCRACLSGAAPELTVCPNCGSEALRPAMDADAVLRQAKGEALGPAQDYSRQATADRKGYDKKAGS